MKIILFSMLKYQCFVWNGCQIRLKQTVAKLVSKKYTQYKRWKRTCTFFISIKCTLTDVPPLLFFFHPSISTISCSTQKNKCLGWIDNIFRFSSSDVNIFDIYIFYNFFETKIKNILKMKNKNQKNENILKMGHKNHNFHKY